MAEEKRILIIDDDTEMLKLLEMALDAAGYTTMLATTGEEALAKIEKAMPALILLDLRMPGMGGKRFAAAFHAQYGHDVPLLVMTGHTEGRERATEVGAVGYVAKPFALDALVDEIAGHLGRVERKLC